MFLSAWYGDSKWTYILWPLMMLYRHVVNKKRAEYLAIKDSSVTPVPVIVVGNITVGGTGKTPVVQSLVRYLQKEGYKPGIVSRGYGGEVSSFPYSIKAVDDSKFVGDEPYMLFHSLNVPIVIDPKRKNALMHILTLGVDIVISDDGMQHYDLPRDIEICVLDGSRGLGNQKLIPVGPLREPSCRLNTVDFILESAHEISNTNFAINPKAWVSVKTGRKVPLNSFKVGAVVDAIAGIGNPDKFFDTLLSLNINCTTNKFADHYAYGINDLKQFKGQVLMTEKDAVKIRPFAHDNMWFLEIEASLSDIFFERFSQKINSLNFEREHRD
ncbi:MAG: tetraacyldisaccharide 4'-kinase [Bermanella sp.]|jgi:tetraacyldisaccharide 4'-kinase